MNQEHDDEREARSIVETALTVKLEHSDKNGGVDYRSKDGRLALEVTRVTDGRRRAARRALDKSRAAHTPDSDLQTCWSVFVGDTQWGLQTFLQRVHAALIELELVGEAAFEHQRASVHVLRQGPLAHIYRPLLDAGVERASALPPHRHDDGLKHRILPMLGSGGSSDGSNEALALLAEVLQTKRDNAKKLTESGAEQRHLFIWLDDDTRFDIARPLSREAPEWRDEGFGLPSTPPTVDPAITHLWLVHDRSRLGWLWDGNKWHELGKG